MAVACLPAASGAVQCSAVQFLQCCAVCKHNRTRTVLYVGRLLFCMELFTSVRETVLMCAVTGSFLFHVLNKDDGQREWIFCVEHLLKVSYLAVGVGGWREVRISDGTAVIQMA